MKATSGTHSTYAQVFLLSAAFAALVTAMVLAGCAPQSEYDWQRTYYAPTGLDRLRVREKTQCGDNFVEVRWSADVGRDSSTWTATIRCADGREFTLQESEPAGARWHG